jgi:hypothetical protein
MATTPVDTGLGSSRVVPRSTVDQQFGFARLYMDPRYRPMTTPQDVLIEQARLREQEAMRQWREAQAAIARQNAAMPPPMQTPAQAIGTWMDQNLPGQNPRPDNVYGMADSLLAKAVASDPTIPAGLRAGFELRAGMQPGTGVPAALPPGTTAERGPERPGYIQQPVMGPQGATVGYKYVPLGSSAVAAQEAEAEAAGPIGPDGTPMPKGNDMAGSSAALSGYDPENYAQDGGLNKAWNAGENSQQAAKFMERYQSVQQQAYGAPKGEPMEGPNGEIMYQYDGTYQRYIGIDKGLQSQGYIPTRLPNPLGPNATQAQREQYQKRSEAAFIAPRYVVGQNYYDVQRMDRAGKIALQKQMRNAGLYSSTAYIIPGVFSSDDYAALEKVYGFSNQTGLTADQVLKEFKAATDAAKARAGGGGGGGGAGGNTTSVNIQYAQTSLAQGRALLARTLSDALGRPPTQAELAEFMNMLNAQENKSPTKTVTNYVKDGTTTTATSRTNPSEVDADALAREFAMRINGGADFDVNQTTRYMDMLVNRLIGAANV